jgi:hypothetical protein
MPAWSNPDDGLSLHYPGPSPAWHVERFSQLFGMDVVIDDQMYDSQFAIDAGNAVTFISAFLGPTRRFHRTLMDAALTAEFGPGPWAGTRQLPGQPRLISAYGNLVAPQFPR